MEKVINFLTNELKNHEHETLIVAISGGPDSMALLKILVDIQKNIDIKLVCAHVNHNLREESAEEKDFVEKYCINNNVVFEFMKIEEYTDDNFHNQARSIRYKFFESLVKKYNAKYLLTAHHGDDLMETILMRITRGSTLKGYSGFSKKLDQNGYTMLRPLIYATKDQILKYVEENKIEYRTDKSNTKDKYTRNRYRKYVLPFFKNEDPNVNEKFLKFSETLIIYNDYIEKIMAKTYNQVFNNNTISIEEFNKLDEIIKIKTINFIFENIYDDDLMLINDSHTKAIIDMINSDRPNMMIYLPNSIQAIKSYNVVKILNLETKEDYKIELLNTVNVPNGTNIKIIDKSDLDDNSICRLNEKDFKRPLYIRNRRNGDTTTIKGMIGTKKLKDIFINEKKSYDERNMWPILVDSEDKILWIPGIKKTKFNQPKDKSCDIIIKYE